MKFKDKDGNVFEDIAQLLSKYCYRRYCSDCKFYPKGFVGRNTCGPWARENPAEAARLMGYEVVEDDSNEVNQEIQQEEANMGKQKPLSEWTLGEVKEHCKAHSTCHGCRLFKFGLAPCLLEGPVQSWDLTDSPRFTEEEVAAAKVLRTGGIEEIERSEYTDGDLHAYSARSESGGRRCWNLPPALFPSILPGQSVRLSEIVGKE